MTTVRTVAVHEIVQRTYPRPPRDGDALAMAIGRAIDSTLSEVGHRGRLGRPLSAAAVDARAAAALDAEVAAAAADLPADERLRRLEEIRALARLFRASELYGLARPRSRVILLGGEVGVYAQPDFWDGAHRFFEMKSYRSIPPPPDVGLQLRLFQLAFPGLQGVLVCLDRHARPPEASRLELAAPTALERTEALRRAWEIGRAHGIPKVLEYLEGPFVAYPAPSSAE